MKMNKDGKVLVVVGAPQTGKSTKINELINGINLNGVCAIDPYNDYPKEVLKFELDEFESMIDLALNSTNKTFIFEEATSYFYSNLKPIKMKKLLTGAMGHYKHNIILVFHNRKDIPTWAVSSINAIYYTKDINKGKIEPPFDRIERQYKWYMREEFY